MRDLLELAIELLGHRWLERDRPKDGSNRWDRMSDHEQLATRRRYVKRSFWVLALILLGGSAVAGAAVILWERHQIASAVTLALGLAAVVMAAMSGVLTWRVLRSHPWPPMDPTVALEAHESDARVELAANLAVAATVCVSVGMTSAWIISGLPEG